MCWSKEKVDMTILQGRRHVYGHSGLVRTKFWDNHISYTTGDDKFSIDILISPDKVEKRSYTTALNKLATELQ